VSPDFLASEFVWREEMREIVRHRDQQDGLIILPLIIRPCAWRLAPELAALQARPRDGRALALDQDSVIDSHLSDFVYELATRIEQLPTELPEPLASVESDRIRSRIAERPALGSRMLADAAKLENTGGEQPIVEGQQWIGDYFPTNRKLKLLVQRQNGKEFTGVIRYDEGSRTFVEGRFMPIGTHALQQEIAKEAESRGVVKYEHIVEFEETKILDKGERVPTRIGRYVGALSGTEMAGVYWSEGRTIGQFYFSLWQTISSSSR
jgi:hypothetical protein